MDEVHPSRPADGEHRAQPPGHARRPARRGAARRRDHPRGAHRDRLPPPLLREGGRGPHLGPGHALHRPPELLLGHAQQLDLRRGGGEAARRRGHAALPGDPGDRQRAVAHHRPPGLRLRQPGRHRRADQLLVPVQRPREHLRDPREAVRLAADHQLRAHRRPEPRSLRRASPTRSAHKLDELASGHRRRDGAGRAQPHLPGPHRRRGRRSARRTPSASASPVPACGPPAWTTTCASTRPTRATRSTTSTIPTGDERRHPRPHHGAHGRDGPEPLASSLQALDKLPDGPLNVDDRRVVLPPKDRSTAASKA